LKSNDGSAIKSLSFNGIECLTDMAIYLIYKYVDFRFLETITLDACRYITDFGISLLRNSQNMEKNLVLSEADCCGCTKLIKSIHKADDKDDLFLTTKFTKCSKRDTEIILRNYKILVYNLTQFNMTHLIVNNILAYKESFVFNYGKTKLKLQAISSAKEFNLNIIEIDSVCCFRFFFSLNTGRTDGS
jgi:hypothetical protein